MAKTDNRLVLALGKHNKDFELKSSRMLPLVHQNVLAYLLRVTVTPDYCTRTQQTHMLQNTIQINRASSSRPL